MPKDTFFNLPDDKRERITQLAVDEFATNTYEGASISRICRGAGIAKGSFYQYFEDKLDLYRYLLLQVMGKTKLSYFHRYPPPSDADVFAYLGHLLLVGIRFGLENPRLAQVGRWVYYPSTDPQLRAMRTQFMASGRDNIVRMLQAAMDDGELRPGLDLQLAATHVMVVQQHMLEEELMRHTGKDLIEWVQDPDAARSFGEAEQKALVTAVIDQLRHGLGSGRDRAHDAQDWNRLLEIPDLETKP